MFYRTLFEHYIKTRLNQNFYLWDIGKYLENLEVGKQDLQAFYRQVGQNVKRIRAVKGISQLQLASLIGHDSVAHIAKAELNKYDKRFNLEHLYKISIALNVDIKEFFDGTEELRKK